ncbi:MAG: hypothetical protein ACYC92_07050 [Candidatus Acidiferrales bacterium]
MRSSASEPFLIDHNRIFVELEFARPDGSLRKTLAFVDTGDPEFEFTRSLADDLHLDKKTGLQVRFGGIPLKVSCNIKANVYGGKSTFPGMVVEANLPSTILDQYDVLIDYAKQKLTLARAGTVKHEGVRVPCAVNRKTGLVSIQAAVAGKNYSFSVDNGAAYTWIARAVATNWVRSHPQWLRGSGAVGDANMNGSIPELTGMIMRVGEIGLGPLRLRNMGALGVGPGWDPKTMPRFFDWYSEKTPTPVVGFLGGNLLRDFRLEIDYPEGATYWSRERNTHARHLDQIGIIVGPTARGGYIVVGVAQQHGKSTVEGVMANDELISVDGVAVTGATMGKVLTALHGSPGEIRKLVLKRRGKEFTVEEKVTRF